MGVGFGESGFKLKTVVLPFFKLEAYLIINYFTTNLRVLPPAVAIYMPASREEVMTESAP